MMLLKKLIEKIKKFYYKIILKKRYYRFGECKKCGCCCENIYIFHAGKIIKTKEEFFELQKTSSYPFYHYISAISKDDFGLIFECNKFDKEKRLCKDHKRRCSICKNYPQEDIFKMGAALKDGCGYRFEPIENFEEVLKKVSSRPLKNFEEL